MDHRLDSITSRQISRYGTDGTDVIHPVDVVRDFGVCFNTLISGWRYTRFQLPCLASTISVVYDRNNVEREVNARLVSVFVISRLDHCNSVLDHRQRLAIGGTFNSNLGSSCCETMQSRDINHMSTSLAGYPLRSKLIQFRLFRLVHNAFNGRAQYNIWLNITGHLRFPEKLNFRIYEHFCISVQQEVMTWPCPDQGHGHVSDSGLHI